MALLATEKYYKVLGAEIISALSDRPKHYGSSSPAPLGPEQDGSYWYQLWVDERGDSPGQHYIPVVGDVAVNTSEQRCERVDTWEEMPAADIRDRIANNILSYLDSTDETQVSTRFDPARVVLMDEGIAAAKREQGRLDLTADADLQSFALNFDPTTIGSIDTAKTLYAQSSVVLRDDPTLTPEQTADLEAVQPLYADIANGSDDAVDVPSVPDSVRRKLGVTGEGYGTIRVRRFLDAGWWWLEFELVTRRELKAGDYWIALYNAEGVYLSTPQLTKVADGKYFSDKSAVNSPQSSDQVGYQYTLCFQHISSPQFDRIVIEPGVHTKIDRVRWNGNAQGAVAAASTRRRRGNV